ncbi:MAG: hypothetical protein FWG13_00255 [Leptospirales bacterium]|nr:hypothetical protein [Leptospirales bacterium]
MESTKPAKKTVKKAVKKTVVKKEQTTAKKPTVKTSSSGKKKTNLLRLYSEMSKLVVDAVDREIVKRFKIIVDTGDDDITKQSLLAILKEPDTINPMLYEERLQPYIKHYLFMLKRKANKNKNA